ncbi:MAG: ABC transporter permease [Candidatus Pacebacteria bacterium]|nr:ABC transporter permease [Candidatus Paceibacterota bacterium]MCF7857203.1 ABC transporter permease [Candidatus Paceibacterota bacterium]
MINWIGVYTMIRREVERTMRVIVQTLISPVVSAALYIFIFGHVIGTRISDVAGVPYITFVFPGILMLSIINVSFSSSSSSLYFARFMKSIDEILIAPFSYIEMIFGFMLGSVIRAVIVAILIVCVGTLFGAVSLEQPLLFIFYIVAVSGIFSLLGILVALWAQGFEQLSILNTFFITPLTYLGGIFYSITMLPPLAQTITRANPFFYFVDGLRSSMTGVHEANAILGLVIIFGILSTLTLLVVHLFKIGWRIRA